MAITQQRPTVYCAAALLAALLSTHTRAAQSQAPGDISSLDLKTLMEMDVTLVTAQKRTEDVKSVPISMSVIKADTIAGLSLATTLDLQMVAPGLTTTNNIGFMIPYMRGVGTDINSSGIEPSVAIYVDGVYQAERVQALADLADVEQIDILKGPQGTLYGRNATGGAINITTRGPGKAFVATAEAGGGSLGLRQASAFVAGPLSDRVRMSLSASARHRDGYYTNDFDGQDVNGESFYSVQHRTQVDIADSLSAELMLKYFGRDDSGLHATQLDPNSYPALVGIPVTTRPYHVNSELTDSGNRLDSSTVALRLSWDTPLVRVQSITSHSHQNHRFEYDPDTSPEKLVELFAREGNRAVTEELQLTPAQPSERLDWLLGAFYIDSASAFEPFGADTVYPDTLMPVHLYQFRELETQAYAAFGEATWSLNDVWSVTGGLRYSYERKDIGVARYGILGPFGVSLAYFEAPALSQHWDDTTYRLILKCMVDRTMLYAKTETGFKSGAYNIGNPLDPGPLDPEQITAYEIGMKSGVGDLPLHVSLAAFYNDYRDLQLQVQDTQAVVTRLVQAPQAETYGVDANLEWKASAHWSFSAGLSWLDTSYREFVSSDLLVPGPFGGNVTAPNLDVSGNNLSRSPALTGNVLASFSYPIVGGDLVGSANYYRSSRIYFEPTNLYSQEGFSLVNASIGYRSREGWSVAAWGRNLGNEVYLDTILPGALGTVGQYAEPRTYGINVSYSFAK